MVLNFAVDLMWSLHVSEDQIKLNSIKCKFGKRYICSLHRNEILHSIHQLQFGLQDLIELDSFEQTIEGRHKDVQVRISILDAKQSRSELNQLVSGDQEIFTTCYVEPTDFEFIFGLEFFYFGCNYFLEYLVKDFDSLKPLLLHFILQLLVYQESCVIIEDGVLVFH